MKAQGMMAMAVAALVSTSCVTNSPNLTQVEDIGSGDGVLVARFHSVQAIGQIAIHQGIVSLPFAGFSIQPSDQLKVIKIKAGEGLRISSYKVGGKLAYFDRRELNFDVRPKTITYIGDIYVDERRDSVVLRVRDEERETIEAAKIAFPQIFAALPYMKSVPVKKPS